MLGACCLRKERKMNKYKQNVYIITAGSSYLDIDAYACCVAMRELLELKNKKAVAYSDAPFNYSVCRTLIEEGQFTGVMPDGYDSKQAKYIIVDVSDPNFLGKYVPIDQVSEVYDHHVGFEAYWIDRIGPDAHIEFIGAAATLVYREWKKTRFTEQMKHGTAKLLIAAILDNTLNLTSSNTTPEDIEVFRALCEYADVGEEFRASYFSEVQKSVEVDLKNALFSDIKSVCDNPVLPSCVAQLCVWNAKNVLDRLSEIRGWFAHLGESWMVNLIDLSGKCSYFVCDEARCQRGLERVFGISFEKGVAKTLTPYLRKQIIKSILNP